MLAKILAAHTPVEMEPVEISDAADFDSETLRQWVSDDVCEPLNVTPPWECESGEANRCSSVEGGH